MLQVLQGSWETSGNRDIFYLVSSMASFESRFTELLDAKSWSITAVIIPATASKDTKHAEWGTYEMPKTQSPLKRRHQLREEPLSDTEAVQPVESFTSPISPFQDSEPLRGILPACYRTQSACEETTRNCTGHGSCAKKYHDPDSGADGLDCYACMCTRTISEDGRKTTYWGGPACQKKDISVQFWLIALFTVGMVFLISFAIGSVWEMGGEELPGVIGAGVSGPSARK